MTTTYKGIDYGLGNTNRDRETGIRFGVIPQNEVGEAWFESSEPDYGEPHCPKCGEKLPEGFGDNESCPHCEHEIGFVGEECLPDEPNGFTYESSGYVASSDSSGDIFILKAPYFTYAQFCSPCAPGACYLTNSLENPDPESDANNRAYCFGHDWFEGGKAPYPVYSVESGEIVQPTA